MKKPIAFISAMAVALCGAFLTACKPSSDFERVIDKGTFVVGVTIYEPMDYIDGDGEWAGFDAEVAALVAAEWGVKIQYTIIKWNNKVAELDSYAIDAIWNGMTADAELGKQIDFSASYAENKQVAVVKKSDADRITDGERIKACSVAVERGSAGDTVATETVKAAVVNRVDTQVNALLEVASGASEVAIIDYVMADSVVGKGDYSELAIVDPDTVSYDREVFAVGLRKGRDLTEKINALLKKYYADGTLRELADKYGSVALNTSALSA